MNVTLRIETRTVVRILLTIALFGVAVFFVSKIMSALAIFAIAAFLAMALNPPVTRLAGHLPGHSRILATALAYVVVLSILGTLVYIAAPPVYKQTNDFVSNLPSYVDGLASRNNGIGRVIERYGLRNEVDQLIQKARQEAGTVAQGVGSSFVSGVTNVLNGTVTMLTILVLTFLMLIEGPAWMHRIWALYTDKRRLARDQRLIHSMYKVVTGFVNGQVVVAAINATGVLISLFILTQLFDTVPMSAILPITGIIFVAALIPMFGATVGAIIATTVLLFSSVPAALIFLAYYFLYQQIENNIIQPVVQSRTIQLTALMVFTAAILGVMALGIVGAVMAIPIAGCIRVLAVDYLDNREDYFHGSRSRGEAKTVTIKAK